jgi:hypothetical protein
MSYFTNNTSISINFEFWEKEIKYPSKKPSCELKLININSQKKYKLNSYYNEYYIFDTNNKKICTIENDNIIMYDNTFICKKENNNYILENNNEDINTVLIANNNDENMIDESNNKL